MISAPESVYDLVIDGSKIGWYRDRVEAWKRGEKIAPITIDVAWTRKCQAACGFCFAQTQASAGGTITKQNAMDFLSDAAEVGVKGVSLISDGESTLVPWYAESIEHAASVGLAIGVGSNGIALRKPVLERILRHLTYLRFNFSAGEPKRFAEIMGVRQHFFDVVVQNIRDAMEIKRRDGLGVNINMQMVTMPDYGDQIMPLARLAKELRVDYLVFKHCSDDKEGSLGVDYKKYDALHNTFKEAESLSDGEFRVVVKWSRIQDDGKRRYTRCFAPPFQLQISGNGLVSTCGLHFNEKYKKFHIGSICTDRFRDIVKSDRYWDVMSYTNSELFRPDLECGSNCLQTKANEWLFDHMNGVVDYAASPVPPNAEFL